MTVPCGVPHLVREKQLPCSCLSLSWVVAPIWGKSFALQCTRIKLSEQINCGKGMKELKGRMISFVWHWDNFITLSLCTPVSQAVNHEGKDYPISCYQPEQRAESSFGKQWGSGLPTNEVLHGPLLFCFTFSGFLLGHLWPGAYIWRWNTPAPLLLLSVSCLSGVFTQHIRPGLSWFSFW